MADYAYHSLDDLQKLGEKIRAKAIKVTMSQDNSYGQAQQQANNDATRYDTGQQTQSPHYTTPSGGRPDDDGNLRAYVTGAYQDIPLLFTQFAVPDPASAQPILDQLYKTAVTLQPSLELKADGGQLTTPLQVGDEPGTVPVKQTTDIMVTHLKQWEGQAADQFEVYVKALETSAAYQRQVSVSLANGVEAMMAVRRSMLTDIWEIGDKTYKALDELDSFCTNSASQAAKITVVGALAAVAFVATDGAAAIAVEGLQSAAAIMGANQTLQQAAEEPISGATVPPILAGMTSCIQKVRATVDEHEQTIARAIQAVATSLDGVWNQALLRAPASLTTAAASETRTQLEQPSGFYLH
jgi:hypothetical protein